MNDDIIIRIEGEDEPFVAGRCCRTGGGRSGRPVEFRVRWSLSMTHECFDRFYNPLSGEVELPDIRGDSKRAVMARAKGLAAKLLKEARTPK